MSERISADIAQKKAVDIARTRLLVGSALMAAAFLVIGARLVDVTIFSEAEPSRRASVRNIAAESHMDRADIVDRNGVLLATSLNTASLYANPKRIFDPHGAARAVVGVLPELSEAEVALQLSSDREFVWLSRNLTPRQQYEVNRLGIPGLDFRREQHRVYPLGRLTAHIVGFASIDNDGLAGIEKSFDAALSERRESVTLPTALRPGHWDEQWSWPWTAMRQAKAAFKRLPTSSDASAPRPSAESNGMTAPKTHATCLRSSVPRSSPRHSARPSKRFGIGHERSGTSVSRSGARGAGRSTAVRRNSGRDSCPRM